MTGRTRNARRKTNSLLGLLASFQLQGCLMAGHAPSGGDMRLLYAAVLAVALIAILWSVVRFMK